MPLPADEASLYQKIGERLSQHRRSQGLSQEQIATIVGLSRAGVANIEAGRQRLSVYLLLRLANAVKASIHELLPLVEQEDCSESLQEDEVRQLRRMLAALKKG